MGIAPPSGATRSVGKRRANGTAWEDRAVGMSEKDKMACLSVQWRGQQAEERRLDTEIEANLERLGFGMDGPLSDEA